MKYQDLFSLKKLKFIVIVALRVNIGKSHDILYLHVWIIIKFTSFSHLSPFQGALRLNMLGKNFSRRHFEIFFF